MIGAANTIVNTNGVLKGYNTDWFGVVTPLEEMTYLKDKNISVIGAGGASRAIVYGVKERGAKVTIYNRTIESAQQLAHEFDCRVHQSKIINIFWKVISSSTLHQLAWGI